MDAPQQVHVDEEVLQQVVSAGDDQCHHEQQQEKLGEVGAQHTVEGTDHTLQLCGAPFLEQQMGEMSGNSHEKDDELLLQVAKGQHEDPFLHDILGYLHNHTLPNETRRTQQVATEAAQCFVQGGVLYRLWWPQHTDATAQTQVQLAMPLEL